MKRFWIMRWMARKYSEFIHCTKRVTNLMGKKDKKGLKG
jgi:hypothetical protein